MLIHTDQRVYPGWPARPDWHTGLAAKVRKIQKRGNRGGTNKGRRRCTVLLLEHGRLIAGLQRADENVQVRAAIASKDGHVCLRSSCLKTHASQLSSSCAIGTAMDDEPAVAFAAPETGRQDSFRRWPQHFLATGSKVGRRVQDEQCSGLLTRRHRLLMGKDGERRHILGRFPRTDRRT
jgi:hypothetical protein